MGTWGYGLYSDDVTRDVKDIYVDKLRRGKSGMQASKEMIAEFKWALDDEDDAPLFWFAMADTQWNYGRLQNEVKTQALYYLNDIKNLQRWEFENPKMFSKRKEVLNSLCKKIMTQQPPEKKVSLYHLHYCQWKIGDIYSYQLDGENAKKRGIDGCHLLFYKVAESTWWPGHVIPVVYIKLTKNDEIPKTREEIEKLEYIQESILDSNDFPDLTPPDKEFVMEIKENICPVYWRNVEETILEKYFLYNKKENVIYQNAESGSGSKK